MRCETFSLVMAFVLAGCVESRQVPDDSDSGVTADGDVGDSGVETGPDGGDTPDAEPDSSDDPDDSSVDATPASDVGTCSAPLILETVGTVDEDGNIRYLGATTDGLTELDGACQEKTGKENVFLLTAPGRGSLVISTGSERTNFDTVLYVRTDCSDEDTELACDDDGGPELQSHLSFNVMGGEHLFIIVDSIEDDEGTFELSVIFEPAPATGETCDDAIPLTFTDGEAVVAQSSGSTSDDTNDHEGTCSSEGPDRFYSFTITESRTVVIRTESEDDTFDMVLNLWDSCAAEGPLDCGDSFFDEEEELIVSRLEAGTYVVGIDGYFDTDSGPFELEVSAIEPIPTCEQPHDLVVEGTTDVHGVLHYLGDTTTSVSELEGSCGIGLGREAVLEYTATDDGLLILSTDHETTEFDTVIYVMSDCDEEESELACNDDGGEDHTSFLLLEITAGETIQIVVDSPFSSDHGAFELTTELIPDLAEPIPGGENEGTAAPLSLVGGHTVIANGEGSTIGADDDIEGSCIYFDEGVDHVYSFTLVDERDVRVILETAESFDAGLYVRTSSGDELECADSAWDNREELFLSHLPVGTYFVIVDGYDEDEFGHYDLMVIASLVE